jgi:hypothetical protein
MELVVGTKKIVSVILFGVLQKVYLIPQTLHGIVIVPTT